MAKKKDDSKQSSDQALIERVDAMMDPRRPDKAVSSKQAAEGDNQQPPPLDIFKDLPGKLIKKVETPAPENSVGASSAPPLPGKSKKQGKQVGEIQTANDSSLESTPEKLENTAQTNSDTAAEAEADTTGLAELLPDKTVIDSPENDVAVDDIVIHEADTVLAVEDAKLQQQAAAATPETHRHPFLRGVMTLLITALIVGVLLVIYLTLSSIL